MKLQISFDTTDLSRALAVAQQIQDYADIFEVGTLLIYYHGYHAVTQFKEKFPHKIIMADSKIVDRGKEAAHIFTSAGADWITVMAGTSRQVIHAACMSAHDANKKVMLDLVDASSPAQSALEAKSLGVDALLLHQPADEKDALAFLDHWDFVQGNASVPIFISAKIKRDVIQQILSLKPHGIVIGRGITGSENPREEARYYYELCNKNH